MHNWNPESKAGVVPLLSSAGKSKQQFKGRSGRLEKYTSGENIPSKLFMIIKVQRIKQVCKDWELRLLILSKE